MLVGWPQPTVLRCPLPGVDFAIPKTATKAGFLSGLGFGHRSFPSLGLDKQQN